MRRGRGIRAVDLRRDKEGGTEETTKSACAVSSVVLGGRRWRRQGPDPLPDIEDLVDLCRRQEVVQVDQWRVI